MTAFATIGRLSAAMLLTTLLAAAPAGAAPWIWDLNQNKIDDRIEAVNVNGPAAAHVGGDLGHPLRIFVYPSTNPLTYGVYVGYDHMPTDLDLTALQATGAVLSWRPQYIPYLRATASFAQIQALAGLAGVTRVEGWQPMYPFNDNATRTHRVRDAEGGVGIGMFPSVRRDVGLTGRGIVVGILDSGVNDAPDGPYPGHESLNGKWVGGGNFSNPVAALNTPIDGSDNPVDHGAAASEYHGSHVCGTAIGSGGPVAILNGGAPGRFAGMAPEARLVDCKVITDAGVGGGAAQALEWCIAHRNTVWNAGEAGYTYRGVQVVNMSIGGMDASDGTDADCAAVNAAVRAGIVCCIASGNDGNTSYMPSPAAADLAVTVGALQDANTLQHNDDIVTDYSNEGPRTSDGDSDHLDEMKPSVCGSGSDIISVLGDIATNGTEYQNINGTSMACPCITGICALIRQANPGLTPAQVRDVLQNTAEHRTDHGKQPASAVDPFGIDPNYHPSWGWGEADAYAAVKEAQSSAATQVVIEGNGGVVNMGGHLQIPVLWSTQREVGVGHFTVWRAGDVNGVPGMFAAVSPNVAPVGHTNIERSTNRTNYNWVDADPSLTPGTPYWYQVRWTDLTGMTHGEPAFKVTTNVPPIRARVSWAIAHNAIDNDIYARFGSGTDYLHPFFLRPCGGSGVADSSTVLPSLFGDNRIWYWHADLTDADMAAGFLPPSNANPWFLAVREQGYVNTEGIVVSFSVTTYNGAGNPQTTYTSLSAPTPTAEQQTTVFWIPSNPAAQPNHAPVFDTVGNKSIGQGLPLSFVVHATDPDNQALTYSAIGLPTGATFTAGTRTFAWTPTFLQSGNFTVKFRAADSFIIPAADTETVVITVTPRSPGSNTPPVLAFITDASTHVGMSLSFAVSATDAEDATLTYSASPVPSGATFNAATRTFSWTPAGGTEGNYPLVFKVTDPHAAADSQAVTVQVVGSTSTPPPMDCLTDTTTINGTIGVDVQGTLVVENFHPFVVASGTEKITGTLDWVGGPAIDLDLYLVDPDGNLVASGATATDDPEHATYLTPEAGTYQWKVVSFDNPNPNEAYTVTSTRCVVPTSGTQPGIRPDVALSMAQNLPNPFSRSSVIQFSLPTTAIVKLRVYDVQGRLIRTLVDGELAAGSHQRVWDGHDDEGGDVPSGMYFSRLEAPQGVRLRKMMYLRQ